jgi:preprotein translocase subunit SecG
MQTFLMILIAAAALMTLYVLVRGVVGMAQGKDLTGQRSQALMRQRVMFQAVAVILVIFFIMVARGSGS